MISFFKQISSFSSSLSPLICSFMVKSGPMNQSKNLSLGRLIQVNSNSSARKNIKLTVFSKWISNPSKTNLNPEWERTDEQPRTTRLCWCNKALQNGPSRQLDAQLFTISLQNTYLNVFDIYQTLSEEHFPINFARFKEPIPYLSHCCIEIPNAPRPQPDDHFKLYSRDHAPALVCIVELLALPFLILLKQALNCVNLLFQLSCQVTLFFLGHWKDSSFSGNKAWLSHIFTDQVYCLYSEISVYEGQGKNSVLPLGSSKKKKKKKNQSQKIPGKAWPFPQIK